MDKQSLILRRAMALLLTIGLSASLFLFLYYFDNKYTHHAPQAINGALYLSEEEWEKTPIRYLRDGWRYYKDQLLTPDDLKQGNHPYSYLSIGEHSNFAMGDSRRSPHASASYAMTLYLPEKVHTYAIELPEIYSSYRFYVDDQLKLEMGQADPDAYYPQTQCRIITFEGSGKLTLLLAVSDYSWIYSGLVYPPAFGEPLNLYSKRGLRFGLSLIVVTITLMLAMFAFYLALRTSGKNNIWLFFFLCLAAAIFTSYPVVHGILQLPIQPLYSIELVSGYVLSLLVIMLHNRICNVKVYSQMISGGVAAMVCILTLLYGLFAAHLTLPIMLAYSKLVFTFKLLTALYLLITASIAIHRNIEKASALLYADLVYASALIWDRILPNYEPILGGWFQESGSLILAATTGGVLLYDVAVGYKYSFIYAAEQWQMKRQLTMQVDHLRQINQKLEESAQLRHDFRHHLRTLIRLSEENRNHELEEYIRGITVINEGTRLGRLTDHIELDALIQYYSNLAQSSGIKFRARLQLPPLLGFPTVDLCGLIGNLLENAVEACQRQETGDKRIFIAGRLQGDQLEFVIDNSYSGQLKTRGGKYFSSKRDGFGLGIPSVLETVKRHKGIVNLYTDEKGFHAELSLPTS